MSTGARRFILLGLFLLIVPAAVRHVLLWPIGPNQRLDSLPWVYGLDKAQPFLVLIGFVLLVLGMYRLFRRGGGLLTVVGVLIAGVLPMAVYYGMDRTAARTIFEPLFEPAFAQGVSDELPGETLILGLRLGDEVRAYPIRLLAYHHQVTDEVDGRPLLVTYCSRCRTGKIFDARLDGNVIGMELVGAIYDNSVYRDVDSGSYWFQANGKFVTGSLEGRALTELRTDQMTLEKWLQLYPDSLVMQPDSRHEVGYGRFGFASWDKKRNLPDIAAEWQWVLGVLPSGEIGGEAKGYAWTYLAGERLIQDEVDGVPVAVLLSTDGVSHRVWDRRFDDRVLNLAVQDDSDELVDTESGLVIGFDGVVRAVPVVEEPVDGADAESEPVTEDTEADSPALGSLEPVMSTVEFRHSFERFMEGKVADGPSP